jgi:AraC-like DNA-binding protein
MDIRKYYTPIQPSVKFDTADVSYVEFLPDARLQPYIYCYWQLSRTAAITENFTYRVVADGCIDIFFEQDSSQHCDVMGFCSKFTEFPLEGRFCYTGIRFFPSMISQLFGIDAKKLSNRTTPLQDVLPDAAAFITRHMHADMNHPEISTHLDKYFLQILSGREIDPDKRFYNALELIFSHKGVIDIDKGLDTGLSPRQLRRLFERMTGTTAKTFSQVIRFQSLLKETQSGKSASQVFLSMGYYDQSHFIREFKNLYGLTPAKAMRI